MTYPSTNISYFQSDSYQNNHKPYYNLTLSQRFQADGMLSVMSKASHLFSHKMLMAHAWYAAERRNGVNTPTPPPKKKKSSNYILRGLNSWNVIEFTQFQSKLLRFYPFKKVVLSVHQWPPLARLIWFQLRDRRSKPLIGIIIKYITTFFPKLYLKDIQRNSHIR